jgi:hypothetical protein
MPFGLKGAPATFQRLMNMIFQPVLGKFAVVYIDDIRVYSQNEEEHIEHLRTIFDIMRNNEIYAKKIKCYFMQDRVPYLGHFISTKGIEMNPAKIEAMVKWPTPNTVKQLRGLLGILGYYHHFIKDFAAIALPLTKLLKKDTKFDWNPPCDKAKKELIQAITTAPILQAPDFSKKFTVTTDASDQALGAVLSQDGKPIEFLSKKFSDQEINWPTHEKEMFAMVYAINTWRHYLQSSTPFDVITDNIAVTFIQTQAKLSAKQARWVQLLGEFIFTIYHRPGVSNIVADGLSRRDILGITILSNDQWLDTIRELTACLPPIKGLVSKNGLLYKNHRLFIPAYRDIKTKIIQECHDINGSHFGYKKTLASVSRSYFWKNLPCDIKNFVQSCDTCQRNKASNQKAYGLLKSIEPPLDKFNTYSMDFIGPIPKSKSGDNGILVIVDTLTKAVTLEPIKMTYGAPVIAKIFFKRIYTKFGLPRKIISD